MNYKDTLNLPKTTFKMKANLVAKEPAMFKAWSEKGVYHALRKERKGKPKFILHDGPPYANGHIHMGHVLNKILKDIVVKFHTMKGCDAPFVPGWDCHGLPVEHQLFKELKISKYDIDRVEFRKKAASYAMKFVEIQKKEFERLGIFADWERPYLTLDPKYEAAVVRSFGCLVKEGYVYKGLKPVNWCTRCETALAEAEVEYEEHSSPSIYVKFKVKDFKNFKRNTTHGARDMHFIIWTTTPWTLLGNVAVAIHPEKDYAILEADGEAWVMLESLARPTMQKLKKPVKILDRVKGKELLGIECKHPFIDRASKVVLADYVSSQEGTGCVHTAPGHGQEDYLTGKKYNLPIIMPVDSKGIFDKTCGEFSGLHVRKANDRISERLQKDKALLFSEKITHSYPHCWRCREPIIFRATEQYFVSIDHKNLRKKMLDAVKNKVKWYPERGEARMSSMIENRPDWCISRQRYWGVPIVAFKCKKCEEALLDENVIEHVAAIIEREGSQAWFVKDEKALVPKGVVCGKCRSDAFIKETDIIDVWFESGVSYRSVLKEKLGSEFPCELYLEGSDQHRGWFQSSLIASSAMEGRPPYKNVLTHGFVVDGAGKKMSKSLGNVISPEGVMKKYGADILRLWVASSNYADDVRLSPEILDRLSDAYRKIRNTFRYLLGNTHDFDPKKNAIEAEHLLEIDRWMLSRLAGVIYEADKNYSSYSFYRVFRSVYNFCVYEISSLYLDILKDRLYTFDGNSIERRSCQTVMYEILTALIRILAPILSFTAEEAQESLCPGGKSVHRSLWCWDSGVLAKWENKALDEKWQRLLGIREVVLKAIEEKRILGEIKSSLEVRVTLYSEEVEFRRFLEENAQNLPSLFITSQVEISDKRRAGAKCEGGMPLYVSVEKARGEKCKRCWNYSDTVGAGKQFNDLCARCAEAVERGAKNAQKK
ncbi:MAG: isoleucine--tRNA ligase [Omnitrophica bacterium]|nr:isoleucine--tRNA ligase [Candidatus Omnitrophota bacterium]